MPHARTTPPHDRFFARIDRFECECPHCGKLIFAVMDQRNSMIRNSALSKRQARGRLLPSNPRLLDSVWNPVSQRLKCPNCEHTYMVGLLVYPVLTGTRRMLDPPPDVVPTAREIAACRQRAGGYYATKTYQRGAPVNVSLSSTCSCPPKGWLGSCPVHGDPERYELGGEAPVGSR
jgi:hypothetical protein